MILLSALGISCAGARKICPPGEFLFRLVPAYLSGDHFPTWGGGSCVAVNGLAAAHHRLRLKGQGQRPCTAKTWSEYTVPFIIQFMDYLLL